MLAVAAVSQSTTDPLSGLYVGDLAEPEVPAGWVTVDLVAAALNTHDAWSLPGVGLPADRFPQFMAVDRCRPRPEYESPHVSSPLSGPARHRACRAVIVARNGACGHAAERRTQPVEHALATSPCIRA